MDLVTTGGVKSVAVLRKLEPEEAKKVIDEKAQEVDARRRKKRKDSAASSNSEPNVKIRIKLVAGPGPEKTYIVKGPAAAPRMCIICCRFCCFLSLVMWVFRRESVEAAKGTLIKAATFYPASGYLSEPFWLLEKARCKKYKKARKE